MPEIPFITDALTSLLRKGKKIAHEAAKEETLGDKVETTFDKIGETGLDLIEDAGKPGVLGKAIRYGWKNSPPALIAKEFPGNGLANTTIKITDAIGNTMGAVTDFGDNFIRDKAKDDVKPIEKTTPKGNPYLTLQKIDAHGKSVGAEQIVDPKDAKTTVELAKNKDQFEKKYDVNITNGQSYAAQFVNFIKENPGKTLLIGLAFCISSKLGGWVLGKVATFAGGGPVVGFIAEKAASIGGFGLGVALLGASVSTYAGYTKPLDKLVELIDGKKEDCNEAVVTKTAKPKAIETAEVETSQSKAMASVSPLVSPRNLSKSHVQSVEQSRSAISPSAHK